MDLGFRAPSSVSKFAFNPGERIDGRYEVDHVLGGGMGTVYVVYDHQERNVLALKTFQDLLLGGSVEGLALEQSFEKEALAWIALDRHPYIVQAYWVQELRGRLFIAMEYVAPDAGNRNTLREYLLGQPLPLDEVLRWGIEFCHGMEHAFQRRLLCHRDIKPENILISCDGHVKIADFGLAVALDQRGDAEASAGSAALQQVNPGGSSLTLMRVGKGLWAGTPGYVAPEVLRGEGAGVRSDEYSFGVVLYQMVTGIRRVLLGHGYELAPVPRVDSALWPLIERCLSAEARSRSGSFALLREELEGLLRMGGVVAKPPQITDLEFSELNNKGISLSNLGREVEALACYDRALEINSGIADVWSNKGISLSNLGHEKEALACCVRALEIDPGNANAWFSRGIALSELGRKEEAIACYDRAVEINPRVSGAWNNRGFVLSDLGRKEEAIACYDRAVEINPRRAEAWNNKGDALSDLGRKEEAIACYDRAVEIDPRRVDAWFNKGNAVYKLGRKEQAIACYDRAVEINPRRADAWNNKGLALSDLGRKDEAIGCYNRALEINSRRADAWNNKGNALSDLGRKEEAIACYDRVLDIDRRDAKAWFNMGNELMHLGRKEEALACYDRSLEIDATDADAWNNKGVALWELGRKEDATQAYRSFIANTPTTYQQHIIQQAKQRIAEVEASRAIGR